MWLALRNGLYHLDGSVDCRDGGSNRGIYIMKMTDKQMEEVGKAFFKGEAE